MNISSFPEKNIRNMNMVANHTGFLFFTFLHVFSLDNLIPEWAVYTSQSKPSKLLASKPQKKIQLIVQDIQIANRLEVAQWTENDPKIWPSSTNTHHLGNGSTRRKKNTPLARPQISPPDTHQRTDSADRHISQSH